MRYFYFLCLLFFSTACFATHTFKNTRYHYSFQYPDNWQCNDRGKGVVVCKAEIGKPSYPVMINIQTIFTKAGGGKYATVKDLMDDFYSQVPLHTQAAKFIRRAPITLGMPNGAELTGEQTELTFQENHDTLQQWQIMLISVDGLVFQAWAFRAPEKHFAENLNIAKTILASWNIS